MPTRFTAIIGVRGANSRVSNVGYDLGEFSGADAGADFLSALGALAQIQGALEDVTDGEIAYTRITHEVGASTVNGSGDSFEKAAVVCYLNDPNTQAEKTVTINIPAPVIGIFQGTGGEERDTVDRLDADLIQYVQQVSQHAYVSDGEQIDTTHQDGIKGGRRVLAKVSLGKRV